MSREPSVEKLAQQAGRLQEQLLNIAKRSKQTAMKDRKAAPVPPAPKKPAVKRPVPPQLRAHVYRKIGKK